MCRVVLSVMTMSWHALEIAYLGFETTPRKKLTTPLKVKEENPRVQLKSCPKTELFKVIEATDINYYLHNSEDIFILKQTEIKSLILNNKDVIRISNSIVKETNGVKETRLAQRVTRSDGSKFSFTP